MIPPEFKTHTQFIGRTGMIQRTLINHCHSLRQRLVAGSVVPVLERRFIFLGPPGNGKSHLAKQLAWQLVDGNWMGIHFLNGANLTMDRMRDWTQSNEYSVMGGDLAVMFVDEIEAIPEKALLDLRTYLDCLANHRIFIGTSNKKEEELPEALQTRGQLFRFDRVAPREITELLITKYALDPDTAHKIAANCRGNVRAAEQDALTARMALMAAAA